MNNFKKYSNVQRLGFGPAARLAGVSARSRVRVLVGLVALAAAGIVIGVSLSGRDSPEAETQIKRGPPPLELSILLRNDSEARALRAAEREYDAGDAAAARRSFQSLLKSDPKSVEAAVGAAVTAWPSGTLERLRALVASHPDSALARLHLGLALYSAGDDTGAAAQWREAKRREPDTPSALRADDLLHPNMAPGHPFFYPRFGAPPELAHLSPEAELAALERDARRGGVDANLLYGVALQRIGRAVSARAAFARAVRLDPQSLPAQVADAVGRFDKAKPAESFSRLGPLARSHPRAAVVRFHLGLLLLWIRDVKDARIQLQKALDADPHGTYGKEAKTLLSRLEAIGT
jgi:tetratricopeptide (TPR) repeat protein